MNDVNGERIADNGEFSTRTGLMVARAENFLGRVATNRADIKAIESPLRGDLYAVAACCIDVMHAYARVRVLATRSIHAIIG